jgi:phosphotransacetylase
VSNQKGQAIVLVMGAIIGLGVLTYLVMNTQRITNKMQIKAIADKDVDRAVAYIGTLLLTPGNCNAIFMGLATAAPPPLTDIKKCTGTCSGTNVPSATALVINNTNNNNWTLFAGEQPARARIFSATWAITTPQTSTTPAILTLTVFFQKNLGLSNAARVVSGKTYTFQTFVVNRTWNYITLAFNAVPNGSTILGCARNVNSTFVY